MQAREKDPNLAHSSLQPPVGRQRPEIVDRASEQKS